MNEITDIINKQIDLLLEKSGGKKYRVGRIRSPGQLVQVSPFKTGTLEFYENGIIMVRDKDGLMLKSFDVGNDFTQADFNKVLKNPKELSYILRRKKDKVDIKIARLKNQLVRLQSEKEKALFKYTPDEQKKYDDEVASIRYKLDKIFKDYYLDPNDADISSLPDTESSLQSDLKADLQRLNQMKIKLERKLNTYSSGISKIRAAVRMSLSGRPSKVTKEKIDTLTDSFNSTKQELIDVIEKIKDVRKELRNMNK